MRTGKLNEGNIYDEQWLCDGAVEQETVMIRRDPVERLISGYRNFRDKRGLTLDFPDFLRELPNLMAQNHDYLHHFRLQSSYHPDHPLSEVDHVFDFEDFPRIKSFFEARLGQALPDLHHQKACFNDFTVTEKQIDLIQNYYVNDYLAGFGDIVDDTELGLQSERIGEAHSD